MAAGRVLVVTTRDALAANVARLCALAGLDYDLERTSTELRASWRSRPLVILGSDVAAAVARGALPRRGGILVAADGEPDRACWQAALDLGARRIFMLPADDCDLVSELRDVSQQGQPGCRVLAVVGGCGGAGASTLAAGLALMAAGTGPTVLIDADPLGGGLDVLLGAEQAAGLRWPDLLGTRGRLDPAAFAAALCQVSGLAVLAHGRGRVRAPDVETVEAVLDAARRAFATVVVDVPRVLDHGAALLLDAAAGVVVVTPAEVRAVAATANLLATHAERLWRPLLVVRDPGGARLSAREVGDSLGVDVAASLPAEPAVALAAHRGEPPTRRAGTALVRVCQTLLAEVTGASREVAA
jgi:secretion/DNA translocation related CpaE-like protein